MPKEILIIDDEADMILLLKIELETEGYSINLAHNGKDGISLIKKKKPDLVLLDVMMPEMDGYQTLASIKEDPDIKDIPVIMLTAKGLEEGIQKALDLGGDDYVSKPFHPGLLIKKIENFF